MRKALGFIGTSLIFAGPALAADLAVTAPVYKAPPAAVVVPTWTGFYVGASLGGRWSDADWTTTTPFTGSVIDPTASLDSSTVRAGSYVGYNWQFARQWVAGIEGDIAWGNGSASFAGFPGACFAAGCTAFDSINVKENWDASLRGRIGYLVDPSFLVYATGGAAWQNTEVSGMCLGTPVNASFCGNVVSASNSTTKAGWTIGGGAETMLWSHWLARVEYRYADYGDIGFVFPPAPGVGFSSNVSLRTHTVYGGLAYKF